jgi:hypothetical protein
MKAWRVTTLGEPRDALRLEASGRARDALDRAFA